MLPFIPTGWQTKLHYLPLIIYRINLAIRGQLRAKKVNKIALRGFKTTRFIRLPTFQLMVPYH
jgi:hypothetical protein